MGFPLQWLLADSLPTDSGGPVPDLHRLPYSPPNFMLLAGTLGGHLAQYDVSKSILPQDAQRCQLRGSVSHLGLCRPLAGNRPARRLWERRSLDSLLRSPYTISRRAGGLAPARRSRTVRRISLFMDEFQLLVHPVALGAGTSLFAGLQGQAELDLVESRQFKTGAILLVYQPKAR